MNSEEQIISNNKYLSMGAIAFIILQIFLHYTNQGISLGYSPVLACDVFRLVVIFDG